MRFIVLLWGRERAPCAPGSSCRKGPKASVRKTVRSTVDSSLSPMMWAGEKAAKSRCWGYRSSWMVLTCYKTSTVMLFNLHRADESLRILIKLWFIRYQVGGWDSTFLTKSQMMLTLLGRRLHFLILRLYRISLRTAVLRLWWLEQQLQYHLGTC